MLIADYSNISYAKPFLAQVIIRLDFLGFIPSDKLLDDKKINMIREVFPIVSMRQIMRFNDVSVNLLAHPETKIREEEGFSQSFVDQADNKLIISNKFLVLEINRYSTYENMFSMFEKSLGIIEKDYLKSARTGIRYINIFEEGQIRLSKKLFNPTVGSLVNAKLSQEGRNAMCVRSLCMNEYQVGDMKLNFRYGMYNPQYPNAMRTVSFVLDYDCFCESIIDGFESIETHIKSGHDAIQELFEWSISDTLRSMMNHE